MPIDYTKRPGGAGPGSTGPGGAGPGGEPAPAGAVSLAKVTLTKATPSVSLRKSGITGGTMRVNLRWSAGARPAGRGLFKRRSGPAAVDLDLGCLFEYTDGTKGVVQALGDSLRDQHSFGPAPIVWLDGDDRSGLSEGGENLYVDLSRSAAIVRILVFAYIYDGTPNWAAANAVVTLHPADGPQIAIALDEHDPTCPMVAIAQLVMRDGELVVLREVRYVQGKQRALDEAYAWGMNWSPARK